jgi:beta-lactam-binding protein with PASTA domain
LKLAGHTGDVSWDDQLCGSVVEGQIIERGEVCRQAPAAGQELSVGAPVRLLVQPEDPRHGEVGQFGEWHLMHDVVGLPLDQAQAAMRAAGFTDENTHVDEREDPACRPRIVCKTYPGALERAGQGSDRYLTDSRTQTMRSSWPPSRLANAWCVGKVSSWERASLKSA